MKKHKTTLTVIITVTCAAVAVVGILLWVCKRSEPLSNIEVAAKYDGNSNYINAVITNNTGDKAISFFDNYTLERREGGAWITILSYDEISLYPARNWAFPYSDDNNCEVQLYIDPNELESDSLDKGDYRLTIDVKLYDSSLFGTISPEAYRERGETTIKAYADLQSKSAKIRGEFTVQ